MTYVQFTEFRNNSKQFFDKVETGSSFIIIKKGKPVAKIVPFSQEEKKIEAHSATVALRSGRTSTEFLRMEREGK